MRELLEKIRAAIRADRFIVSWHADERCEERQVAVWQLVAGLEDARLERERPHSDPYPSVGLFRFWVQAARVGVPPSGGLRSPAEVGTPTDCRSHLETEEPSVVVREDPVDGTEAEAVWAWLPESGRALLVTVYFP